MTLFSLPVMPTPLQQIDDDVMRHAGVRLLMKRDDLTGSALMGNKARKLHYNLSAAREEGQTKLATFGGAYSNHIYAVAAAGKIYGFETCGFIRGEETLPLNPVLRFAQDCGMQLFYIDRERYRLKDSPEMLAQVQAVCGDCYILPEGGTNALAVKGCAKILDEIGCGFDVVTCAVGTGGTMAGIVRGLKAGQQALGFSVLKNGGFLRQAVVDLLDDDAGNGAWQIATDYDCGGYAKTTPELLGFINAFKARTGVPLDAVYTGKMMYGLYGMIGRGAFARGTVIVAVHSGGVFASLVVWILCSHP